MFSHSAVHFCFKKNFFKLYHRNRTQRCFKRAKHSSFEVQCSSTWDPETAVCTHKAFGPKRSGEGGKRGVQFLQFSTGLSQRNMIWVKAWSYLYSSDGVAWGDTGWDSGLLSFYPTALLNSIPCTFRANHSTQHCLLSLIHVTGRMNCQLPSPIHPAIAQGTINFNMQGK